MDHYFVVPELLRQLARPRQLQIPLHLPLLAPLLRTQVLLSQPQLDLLALKLVQRE